jgi:dihydroxyacetone kinase
MSGIDVPVLGQAAQLAHAAMMAAEQNLNEADSRLGDGDTGSMLARVTAAIAKTEVSTASDLGSGFALYARAAAGATGSSLGTLLATALLTLSRETKGRAEVPWSELSRLLEAALEAMMRRGGAALGDKTILDSIHAVASSLQGAEDGEAAYGAARGASAEALRVFRLKPNLIGRARMFGDKSVGHDDPGMLACALLIEGLGTSTSPNLPV